MSVFYLVIKFSFKTVTNKFVYKNSEAFNNQNSFECDYLWMCLFMSFILLFGIWFTFLSTLFKNVFDNIYYKIIMYIILHNI